MHNHPPPPFLFWLNFTKTIFPENGKSIEKGACLCGHYKTKCNQSNSVSCATHNPTKFAAGPTSKQPNKAYWTDQNRNMKFSRKKEKLRWRKVKSAATRQFVVFKNALRKHFHKSVAQSELLLLQRVIQSKSEPKNNFLQIKRNSITRNCSNITSALWLGSWCVSKWMLFQ